MNVRTCSRYVGLGAGFLALIFVALAGSTAMASEANVSYAGAQGASGHDTDALVALDQDLIELGYRPGPPPPPRYRHYRVYRPYWRVRIVPPPLFAPGWFGFYFLGIQPPPPANPPASRAAPVRRPDFRHLGQYSLGISAGAYGGQYLYGPEYSDPGVRFTLSYRNAPVLGAEFGVGIFGTNMRYDGMGSDVRSDIPVQLSAVLHAFPRSPIQPYFLFGATGDIRTYRKYNGSDYGDLYTELRVGPHVGLGVEFLVGRNVSITVDGRSIYYTLIDRRAADQTVQNDVTGTLGMNFYF